MKTLPLLPALVLLTAAVPALSQDIGLRSEPLPLDARHPDVERVGDLAFRGALLLRAKDRRFGGYSALLVSEDGSEFTTVSDTGHWLRARLVTVNDRLAAAQDGRTGPLGSVDGRPLDRNGRDAESLTLLPGGDVLAAYERRHRLRRFGKTDRAFAAPSPVASPPGLERANNNGGLEALTTLADGRLLAITETTEVAPGVVAGWVGDGKTWQRLSYARTGAFFPTGAATLPGGDVVVVERRFDYVEGPGIRLVRLPARQIVPGARLQGTEIARLVGPLLIDNFEGIAVRRHTRRDGARETWIYLISDDNFNPLQRTLLMAFALVE